MMTSGHFPYDRSAFLTLENSDLVKDLRRYWGESFDSDMNRGDATADLIDPPNRSVEAQIVTRSDGIWCGTPFVEWFLEYAFDDLKLLHSPGEGAPFSSGDILLRFSGGIRSIWALERTLLNGLQRLCAISTRTANYVERVQFPCRIAATRKTQYGLLDKYAVAAGGGLTHRLSLGDAPMFKENHLALMEEPFTFIGKCFQRLDHDFPFITVEVESRDQAQHLLEAIPSSLPYPLFVLFDNFSVDDLEYVISILEKPQNVYYEASGGIKLDQISAYSKTGVDVISVGALTHSVPALDFSLNVLGV